MSQRKNYHPSGLSWRERELQKEKDRKEAEVKANEEERLRAVRPTDENFPSLGGTAVRPRPITQTGMFAKLASEWREQSDLEKLREQSRKEEEEREAQRQRSMIYNPRRVGRQSWYVEDRDSEEHDEEESHTPKYGNPLEDEWKTVEYKHVIPNKSRVRYIDQNPDEEDDYEQNAELMELGPRDY